MNTACLRACALLLPFFVGAAQAEFRIDIEQGVEQGIPIVLVAYSESEKKLAEVVGADLARSGFFNVLDPGTAPPAAVSRGRSELGCLGRPSGGVCGNGDGVPRERVGFNWISGCSICWRARLSWRAACRRSRSNCVAWRIRPRTRCTSRSRAFPVRSTPGSPMLVKLVNQAGFVIACMWQMQTGTNPIAILTSPRPLLSPVWSPDGMSLAYVSFETRRPQVFLQNLRDANRRALPGSGRSFQCSGFLSRRAALGLGHDGGRGHGNFYLRLRYRLPVSLHL